MKKLHKQLLVAFVGISFFTNLVCGADQNQLSILCAKTPTDILSLQKYRNACRDQDSKCEQDFEMDEDFLKHTTTISLPASIIQQFDYFKNIINGSDLENSAIPGYLLTSAPTLQLAAKLIDATTPADFQRMINNADLPFDVLVDHCVALNKLRLLPFQDPVHSFDRMKILCNHIVSQTNTDSIKAHFLQGDQKTLALFNAMNVLRYGTGSTPIKNLAIENLPVLKKLREIGAGGHGGDVNYVTFSPDGNYVATASDDKTAKINRLENDTLSEIDVINHEGIVWHAMFSPNGKYVATASFDNTAKINRLENDHLTEIGVIDHDNSVRHVIFSPDGNYIATASSDKTAKISWLENDHLTEIGVIGHDGPVSHVTFSPDGNYIATASCDRKAKINRFENGILTEIGVINHNNWVKHVIFSPDGKYIATASLDGTVKINLLKNNTLTEVIVINYNGTVDQVTFSPDGKYVAMAFADKKAMINVLENNTLTEIGVIGHGNSVRYVTFSLDGNYIATASFDNTAKIYSLFDGRLTYVDTINHGNRVSNVMFSPDGNYIATASYDKTAKITKLFSPLACLLRTKKNSELTLAQVYLLSILDQAQENNGSLNLVSDHYLLLNQLPHEIKETVKINGQSFTEHVQNRFENCKDTCKNIGALTQVGLGAWRSRTKIKYK